MCLNQEHQTTLGLSPDLSRAEQVSFLGKLKQPLVFRDAMLMLRQIVISDSKQEKKPRIEFFAWLEKEIEKRVIAHETELVKMRSEIKIQEKEAEEEKKRKLEEIRKLVELRTNLQAELDQYDVWSDYYKLERKFWQFLRERDYALWFVLDPVITVHKDQVTFEAFSIDESTYGCLSIPMEEFELLKEPKLGTTNIDFSAKLAREMERFRTYQDVTLSVNPDGFTVESGIMPEHIEKKIDLPETWIKGFAQVSSAACLDGIEVTLSKTDLYDICSFLRRHKEKKSPRYMKWILKPEERVRILFEPFQIELVLQAVYHGKKEREEKIWGRRRWLTAEKLIPIAEEFQVKLLGFGMPQFIIADLGGMKMTIGFSSWAANDWVKGTAFHIMAGFIGEGNYKDVYPLLKQERAMTIEEIQASFQEESSISRAGIGMLLRKGEAYYDIISKQIRFRQLCQQPIPEELYKVTEMERNIQNYIKQGMDKFSIVCMKNGDYEFSHEYTEPGEREQISQTKLVINTDGQINKVVCNCKEFRRGSRNASEPCSHILALYVISTKFLNLSLIPEKVYRINDIMEMLL